MHSAKLKTSKRLQRTLAVLRRGKATTRQIIRKAHVCAVNSIITELRANGIKIECRCVEKGIFEYSISPQSRKERKGKKRDRIDRIGGIVGARCPRPLTKGHDIGIL